VNESVRYVNLTQDLVNGSLETLLRHIVEEVELTRPGVVIVDSCRTARAQHGDHELQRFVNQLAVRLTSGGATTLLIGENQSLEAKPNPLFAVADGVLRLVQSRARNSMVRKIQVMKMRGQAPIPWLHSRSWRPARRAER